jgi:ABC-2 type transport system ATP-binding protein
LPIVELNNVVKSYGDRAVVDDVSFTVESGEVFGLIGTNGAGKTTTIRMMLDLVKPDSGKVTILGEALSEAAKNFIGYLPEERGLYLNLTVMESLIYLATLKGMAKRLAAERAEELLRRIDMLPHRDKKIKELSRGMGQFIQFLVTIIHDPRLIVLDEPFANLDPVNTELIREIVLEMRSQGKGIILSTHRMNEVEELCDRILMIDEGRTVLYGDLAEIKERYRNNSIVMEYEGELGEVTGVVRRQDHNGHVELFLEAETTPQQVLAQLVSQGIVVKRFEVAAPPLHDIFLQVVEEEQ